MTLDDLGNLGELLGGVGVVISLLYLAVQIRHSSEIARFDAHRALSNDMASVLRNIAFDKAMFRMWQRMSNCPDQATDEERERFGMILFQVFTTFSDAERFSTVDPDLQIRHDNYLKRFLRMESVQGWWSRQGSHYSDSFRSHVEQRLREIRADRG